jgi:hypothetical protein
MESCVRTLASPSRTGRPPASRAVDTASLALSMYEQPCSGIDADNSCYADKGTEERPPLGTRYR